MRYYEEERHYGRKRLTRSCNGLVFGVCQGLANWLQIPVGIIRVIAVVSFICSGFWPVGAIYLLAAILMPSR